MQSTLHAAESILLLQSGMIVAPGSDLALVLRTSIVSRPSTQATVLGIAAASFVIAFLATSSALSTTIQTPIVQLSVRFGGATWLCYQAQISLFGKPWSQRSANASLSGGFLAGSFSHGFNLEMALFYVVIMGRFNVQSDALAGKFLISALLAVIPILWFEFVAALARSSESWTSVFWSPAIRLITCVLFLISAWLLARG